MKICSKCNLKLSLDNFHKKKNGLLGVKAECKACCSKWQTEHYSKPEIKTKRIKRQSGQEYQLYIRKYRLMTQYGLSLQDYDNMLKNQNGLCKTCGANKPGGRSDIYFHVDHCHTTGKVRGLLCSACNSILGLAKDKICTLENLINYLKSTI